MISKKSVNKCFAEAIQRIGNPIKTPAIQSIILALISTCVFYVYKCYMPNLFRHFANRLFFLPSGLNEATLLALANLLAVFLWNKMQPWPLDNDVSHIVTLAIFEGKFTRNTALKVTSSLVGSLAAGYVFLPLIHKFIIFKPKFAMYTLADFFSSEGTAFHISPPLFSQWLYNLGLIHPASKGSIQKLFSRFIPKTILFPNLYLITVLFEYGCIEGLITCIYTITIVCVTLVSRLFLKAKASKSPQNANPPCWLLYRSSIAVIMTLAFSKFCAHETGGPLLSPSYALVVYGYFNNFPMAIIFTAFTLLGNFLAFHISYPWLQPLGLRTPQTSKTTKNSPPTTSESPKSLKTVQITRTRSSARQKNL